MVLMNCKPDVECIDLKGTVKSFTRPRGENSSFRSECGFIFFLSPHHSLLLLLLVRDIAPPLLVPLPTEAGDERGSA